MQPSQKMIDKETGRYLPVIYPEELPYWEGARKRELWLQRCESCGKARYTIGHAGPHRFSMGFEWRQMSGRGKVHNYVIDHKAWTRWFEKRVPYAVVQVELEEGPRLTTNLLDYPVNDVKIGMPVQVEFEDIPGDITLVQF